MEQPRADRGFRERPDAAGSDDGYDNVARAWKFKSEDKADPDLVKFKQVLHVFESTL